MRRTVLISLICLAIACTDPKQVPSLIQDLHSSKASERNRAALELGRIGPPHANKAVPDLISLLQDENPGVQSGAAYALRKIDTPQARAALDRVRRFKK